MKLNTNLAAANAYQQAQKSAGQAYKTGVISPGSTNGAQQQGNGADAPSFTNLLKQGVDELARTQRTAENAGALSLNNKISPTELVLAINNADTTLRTAVNIRDRMISAYQDIIKMPV